MRSSRIEWARIKQAPNRPWRIVLLRREVEAAKRLLLPRRPRATRQLQLARSYCGTVCWARVRFLVMATHEAAHCSDYAVVSSIMANDTSNDRALQATFG